MTILDRDIEVHREGRDVFRDGGAENWLEGFGVWAGEELQEIEIEIAPPAAEYYAAQRWHAEQDDSWNGESLVRRFPGIVSPELVRRVLSLGRYVVRAVPESLALAVAEDALELVVRMQGGDATALE